MINAKIVELGKMIESMHGLNERSAQYIFCNGMKYTYNMFPQVIYENGEWQEVFYAQFKDTDFSLCEIKYDLNGNIIGVRRFENNIIVQCFPNLKAPVKRVF